MPVPPRTQRPVSRTQPVGPVALKKLPKRHSFQGSRSQPVKKAEVPMPSGNPVGQLAPPTGAADTQLNVPELGIQNPLDVIGSTPSPMAGIGATPTPSPLGNMPDMKTLMQPAPRQWQSNSGLSNVAATNAANKNMLAGSLPRGPRAATPVALPQGPAASPGPGGNPGPAAGPAAPAAPAAILAQPQPGLGKRGAAFEFGKAAGTRFDGVNSGYHSYRFDQPQQQQLDPKTLAILSAIGGVPAGIAGGAMGAGIGGVLGTGAGALRGDAVEGLGRGVIRGGATGVGAGLGAGLGGALGQLTGNESMGAGGSALGALAGGALGYMGSGALLGKPKGRDKRAAFEFGKAAYYGSQTPGRSTGPFSGDAAASVRSYDRLNASARYNEEMNPAHAWLNPAIHGPLSRTFNEQLSQPAVASSGSSYTSAVGAPLAANVVGGVMDAVAPGAGAGASMLGLGAQAIHGNLTDQTAKAREAFDADVAPYRDAPDPAEAAGKRGRKGGPWDASTAAGVVASDDMLASAVRNRKERLGHYLLNPYVQGPIAELFQRYRRRVNAGMHGSAVGTLGAIPTLGALPAILGGPKKQDAARKDYAKRVAPYEEDTKGQPLPKAKPKTEAKTEKPKDKKPKEKVTEKQSAAFSFGSDIARTMKPKQVTRTTGEYRGADMKSNLRKAGC